MLTVTIIDLITKANRGDEKAIAAIPKTFSRRKIRLDFKREAAKM